MNLITSQVGESYESGQTGTLEGLISNYFSRTYVLLNVFIDDPRVCLERSEDIFRSVENTGQYSIKALFAALVNRLREHQQNGPALNGVNNDSLLCWMIKESSELSYADISDVMGMEREQVKFGIAEARNGLLS